MELSSCQSHCVKCETKSRNCSWKTAQKKAPLTDRLLLIPDKPNDFGYVQVSWLLLEMSKGPFRSSKTRIISLVILLPAMPPVLWLQDHKRRHTSVRLTYGASFAHDLDNPTISPWFPTWPYIVSWDMGPSSFIQHNDLPQLTETYSNSGLQLFVQIYHQLCGVLFFPGDVLTKTSLSSLLMTLGIH